MSDSNRTSFLAFDLIGSGCAVSPEVTPSPQHHDRETGGQFTLGQNYPNPFVSETTVPFTLNTNADVRLDLFDLMGRKMAGVVRKGRSAGAQSIKLNLDGMGLSAGDYTYQLEVTTRHGVYRQRKLMTAE
ncbi:T9SS type A sorting domain-containing protein [Hymenobacter properus]|uniref:T9SS type A sorting domain-containing protein n=1 Tax=Hymenobacter properus TaxID=2791026 RepID=A0A931BG70_9BACT|nr:T9SS type A sorting domain-containing protein [Hymenobacter properus]MBF9141891.1 T9SS type A sorting domain-containing protein [Hymenobacter properus]MBR7720699.1 T9SS type A sorting domain-containing protein [Microvirga sp. SRT04]